MDGIFDVSGQFGCAYSDFDADGAPNMSVLDVLSGEMIDQLVYSIVGAAQTEDFWNEWTCRGISIFISSGCLTE